MNAPFIVAQLNNAAGQAATPRIVKVTKPADGQAITIQMDGSVKLDLTAISGEKITLVRVGERLTILFENKSTVTIDPFFDSSGRPLQISGIELDSDRIVSAEELASIFPITDDQSILPAAGEQAAQNTGGQFAGPAVDPLSPFSPLPLLGQEELGNWVSEIDRGPLVDLTTSGTTDLVPTQIVGAVIGGVVEEEHNNPVVRALFLAEGEGQSGVGIGLGNEDPNDANPNEPGLDQDTDGDFGQTTLTVSGTGDNSLAALFSGGNQPLHFYIRDVLSGPSSEAQPVTDATGATVQSHGQDVVYANYVDGPTSDTIEGRSEDGRLVFQLEVNDNGEWTFTLYDTLDHPTPTIDNGGISQGALEEILGIDFSSIIRGVDGNGTPFVLNGTGVFVVSVIDDTPILTAQNGELPTATVDETFLGTPSTADFSGNFAGSFGADGAAANTPVAFTLGFNAGDTGLVDTQSGQDVVLSNNGGVIEGRTETGGELVFTVSVNSATGEVTLVQLRAVTHTDGSNPNDGRSLSSADLVTLTATITDFDGDSVSAVLNIGGNLQFLDDGPTITANQTAPMLTVDETNLSIDATQGFAGAFTSSFGADNAGSITYALGVNAGATGLVDTATNEAVVLVNNNGVVEGRTATTDVLVFTVSVDSSGNVTLDQVRAVVHGDASDTNDGQTLSSADLVTLTATITDKDGDSQSATLDIGQKLVFQDDAPSITANNSPLSLTLDESLADGGSIQNEGGVAQNDETTVALPPELAGLGVAIGAATADGSTLFNAADYGEDGASGTTPPSYALTAANGSAIADGTASGVLDAATNQEIFLFETNGVIVGHVGNSDTNPVAFAISIDSSTGTVTTAQYRAVEHNDSTDHDENTSPVSLLADIHVTKTVTDGDGDQASATSGQPLAVNFEDDGPAAENESAEAQVGVVASVNIVLIIDVSGSMAGDRIALAKDAAINLLSNLDVTYNQVMIVPFSNTSSTVGWQSVDDAKATINGLSTGGATNYEAALDATMNGWGANGPTGATQTLVYFVSDGQPNPTSAGIDTDAERAEWENFLATAPIDGVAQGVDASYAIGIDTVVADGDLSPISWSPNNPDLPPVVISNPADLSLLLQGSLPGNPSGNVLLNDSFGTDGGYVKSVTIEGVTFTYDPDAANPANAITVSGGVLGAGDTIDANGKQIVITLETGGRIVFNFDANGLNQAGDWDYLAPASNANVAPGQVEQFSYVIVDNDGDTASATLEINLQQSPAPVVIGDSQTVDEQGLDGVGSAAATDAETTAGSFTINPNGENFALTLNGTPITAVGNQVNTGKGVLTITSISGPDASGVITYGYSYTLGAPQTHAGQGEVGPINDVLQISVTDGTLDTTTAQIVISIVDDVPTATADGNLGSPVAESATSVIVGTVAGLLGNDTYGADGASATTPIAIGTGTQGGTIAIVGNDLVYTPIVSVGNGQTAIETFEYTITDGDGDTATATFTVTVADDGVSLLSASDLAADEDDLAVVGNNDAALGDDGQVLAGTLAYTLGQDGLGSIELSADTAALFKLDGTPIATSWDESTRTLTGHAANDPADVVFTIVLDAFGSASGANNVGYVVELLQPLKHQLNDDPSTATEETAFEDNLSFVVTATVTDGDGSSGSTTFTVSVDDDVPTIEGTGMPTSPATPVPVGGEFQVNSTSSGDQFHPTVAALTGGGFVVVWYGEGATGWGVHAQIYNASGNPTTSEIAIAVDNGEKLAAVAALPGGGFAVTWTSFGEDAAFSHGVYAQLFNADGTSQSPFLVNETTGGDQVHSTITVLADGSFVVAWVSAGQDGSDNGIYARHYGANGTPLGGEFLVNTTTDGAQEYPAVTALPGGGFVVVWGAYNLVAGNYDVMAQRYDANGNPLGGEFTVSETTVADQQNAAIATLADGSFVVTWDGYGQNAGVGGIFARHFDANGNPTGGEVHVNTDTANQSKFHPAITALADGGYVITWTSDSQDSPGTSGVFGQRFDANGNAVGSEFILNESVSGNQDLWGRLGGSPLAQLASGELVQVWHGAPLVSGSEVYARLFALPSSTVAVDVSSVVSFGADGTAAGGGFALEAAPVQAFASDAGPLQVNGAQVYVVSSGGTLTGFLDNGTVPGALDAGDTQVFTLTVTPAGVVQFTLLTPGLDHAAANDLALAFGQFISATDGDGDKVLLPANAVVIKVDDTGITNVAATGLLADEDDIAGLGNNDIALGDDNQVLSGTLSYTLGGDGLGSIVLSADTSGLVTLSGTAIVTAWDAGTRTLTGHAAGDPADVVFTIVLGVPGGAPGTHTVGYTMNLLQPVKHVLNNDPSAGTSETAFEDNVSFVVTAKVTDSDGSAGTTTFNVSIDDDLPVAYSDQDSLGSEGVGAAISGNVITGASQNEAGSTPDSKGADGATVTKIAFGGNEDASFDVDGNLELAGDHGILKIDANGDYTYTRTSAAAGEDVFTYSLTDGDGDASTATLTIELDSAGKIIVGSNEDDAGTGAPGADDNHVVPNGPAGTDGEITGTSGEDVIVGDPGGITLTAGDKANIVLVLDVSSSMNTNISFGGGTVSRITAMENAVNSLLAQLRSSGAEDVRVHIVKFGVNGTVVGTYDVRADGEPMSAAALSNAQNTISALSNNLENGTNYEAGLFRAYEWINGSSPLSDATVNKVLFISDGEPNAWMTRQNGDDHGASSTPSSANFNQTALDHVTGTANPANTVNDDNTDERKMIENHPNFVQNPFAIEAIGIDLAGTALNRLSVVEDGTSATSIVSAEALMTAVGTLIAGSEIPMTAGSDVIAGGDGADLIFGDVPFTDILAAAESLGTDPAAGWQVFQLLKQAPHNWTDDQIIDYFKANHFALAGESGRDGGHDDITGGAGNDIIYAQEGDDVVHLSWNEGRDLIHGGSDVTGDILKLDISGAPGTVYIETVSQYEARTGGNYVLNAQWVAGGVNEGQMILVSDAAGNIAAELYEIETIEVTGSSANETLVIDGNFTGTSLSPNTVVVDLGGGDDTLDLSGRESGHRVVADGGAQSGGGADTAELDFAYSDVTAVSAIAGGFRISHDGITDEFTNFENFAFTDGAVSYADLLALPTAPSIASVTDNVGTVQGSVANGGVSDDAQLLVKVSLAGTGARAGDSVQLFNGANPLGAAVVLTAGAILAGFVDITTPALASGATHSLNAKVIDIFSGGSAPSVSHAVTIDTASPTLAITDDEGGTASIAGGKVVYTFQFSEGVSGFDAGDITVTGGTAGAFTAVDADTYKLEITPNANATTPIAVSVAAGAATDAAGNGNTAANAVSQPVDTQAPTVTINGATDPATGSQVVFNVVFSEAVTGFEANDISLAGSTAPGTLVANVTGSGTTYQVTVTGMTGNGSVVASVVAGAAIDGAGNPSAASTSNDNSVAFTMNQAPTAANDTIYVSDGANVTVPVSWLLGNDVDPDGPAPIFDAIVSSSGGSSGVFSTTPVYNAGNGTITFSTDGFTNNNNTIRTGSITYRIEDSADPALTKTAVVTVNVVDFGITNGNDNYTIPNTLYQGAYLDGQGGNDAITGGSAADILLGGDGNDTLTGGGGADQIYGGSGSDTLVADQSDVVIDGGSGTDTLRVGADFASTGNGQIVGIENVVVTASGVNLSLSNQTEGFDITAHSGGGTITAGAGADTVNISAGTNATNWTINLGGDTAADKIVFSHASIGSDHNTLATVSNFNVAHDKIAVLLNGANIADGNFRTLSSTGTSNDDVSSGNEIIEITSFTAASLTADGGNAGVESAIASAIDNISAGNYTVIVYSGTGAGADAGIYTMNVTSSVSGSGDLGTAGFSIEHIMTLSGVGYGSLSASNFASTADPIVLDLGQNGITFSNIENGVQFDMDADGEKEQLAWTNGEDGLLVMDLDGSGAIENGTEVLSPHFKDGGYGNSLDALTSLDDNADGILDLSDAAFGDLRVWSDANRDGESQASELLGLSDLGVESIDLGAIVGDSQIDGQHVFAQGQFTMVSGETGDYVGVNFDAVSVGASQMAMAEIENPQPQAA